MGNEALKFYREHGKHHSDTIEIMDGHSLNPTGTYPITAIKGWHKNIVYGLEIFHNNKTMGPKIGINNVQDMHMNEFYLNRGEHILYITGRSGKAVDQLTFHSTLGREFKIGTSTSGQPFKLEVPGKVVCKFKFGISKQLDFIGAMFHDSTSFQIDPNLPQMNMPQVNHMQPMPMNPIQPMGNQYGQNMGNSYPGTGNPAMPYPGMPNSMNQNAPFQNQMNFNQQFQNQMNSNQQFPNQMNPNQQFPNQMNSNQQFPNQMNPNQQFPNQMNTNPQFQNPSFPNQQMQGMPNQMNPYPSMSNPFFFTPMDISRVQNTQKVGGINPDTTNFDDYTNSLMQQIQMGKNVDIVKIEIAFDYERVFGIIIEYRCRTSQGGIDTVYLQHTGFQYQKHIQHESHRFQEGEYITEIYGRSGAIMDQLYIRTSSGRMFGGGGQGGSSFSINIPPGRRVFAFGGGTGGHLHNLYAYHTNLN